MNIDIDCFARSETFINNKFNTEVVECVGTPFKVWDCVPKSPIPGMMNWVGENVKLLQASITMHSRIGLTHHHHRHHPIHISSHRLQLTGIACYIYHLLARLCHTLRLLRLYY